MKYLFLGGPLDGRVEEAFAGKPVLFSAGNNPTPPYVTYRYCSFEIYSKEGFLMTYEVYAAPEIQGPLTDEVKAGLAEIIESQVNF